MHPIYLKRICIRKVLITLRRKVRLRIWNIPFQEILILQKMIGLIKTFPKKTYIAKMKGKKIWSIEIEVKIVLNSLYQFRIS